MMKADRILPIDLYHSVSTSELVLERSLRIYHIAAGQNQNLLPLDDGTLMVVCTGGSFACVAMSDKYEIQSGQVLLLSTKDLSEIKPLSQTGFEGIIIYATEELLINRQRLAIRDLQTGEAEEVLIYIRLIEGYIDRICDTRAKVVECLLRALLISLQQSERDFSNSDKDIPKLMGDFAKLVSRYHHSPAYFYAEKLGMTSQELNNQCKAYSDMSAAEWVSEYVLLEAKDLLSKTRLRPSQIAAMLGFSNHDTFSRWYRRNTGDHPMDKR